MPKQSQQRLIIDAAYIAWLRILPRGRWHPICGGDTEREASLKLYALPVEPGRQVEMITLKRGIRP